MTKKSFFVPRIIALVLVVSCLSFVATSASAVGFTTSDLNLSLIDTVTFRMVEKSLEDPELQALFVAAVAQQVFKETERYVLGNLDTSVPAYIYVHPEEASGQYSKIIAFVDVYYRCVVDSSSTSNSYVFIRFYDSTTLSTKITAFSNSISSNSATADFLSVADPYETPEQITAYLDAQGYTYYTVSPEALAEAQASLESN